MTTSSDGLPHGAMYAEMLDCFDVDWEAGDSKPTPDDEDDVPSCLTHLSRSRGDGLRSASADR